MMRLRRITALMAALAAVAPALVGCASKPKLTEAERNTPPPPGPREYVPPPPGAKGGGPPGTIQGTAPPGVTPGGK